MSFECVSSSSHVAVEITSRKVLVLLKPKPSMAVPASSSAPGLRGIHTNRTFSSSFRYQRSFPTPTTNKPLTVLAMAPIKKVNKYDNNWKKEWFGAGIFYEGSEEVKVDVFKELEKRKVLSNVEKAGLLSKAEELGFTLSSIEKLGVFSKAEDLGLLSLLEKATTFSPSLLASAALPFLVAALAAIVLIPDDSAALVTVRAVVAAALGVGAVGLLVGSVVIGGLQEAD
ncbi:uncharacterized protein LOC133315853 [Gastrolobium bilobum]|uniref:uncharacterized protein LOC133315853 n=1 Tax=Gastrolobium bilobum TaxID=150636 RepID=UPI002AB04BD9|nr:uncharacterized protein LOC133315853 [Gastrolobium bilobum]